jgi:hypothetical protein
LKPPGSKRLKLDYDELLSNFGFNFNLRRYIVAATLMSSSVAGQPARALLFVGRGLHSFRFQLNLNSPVHCVTQLNP